MSLWESPDTAWKGLWLFTVSQEHQTPIFPWLLQSLDLQEGRSYVGLQQEQATLKNSRGLFTGLDLPWSAVDGLELGSSLFLVF